MAVLKASEVKKIVKEAGRRCSKEFVAALDAAVAKKVLECTKDDNDGKKTLDETVVKRVLGE